MDRYEIGGRSVILESELTTTKEGILGRIERLSRFESPSVSDWVIYFSVFIIIQFPAIYNFYHNHGADNPYILFADALLKGHLTLPSTVNPSDLVFFNNHFYLPYPPLPSVLLLPFVALFGAAHVNTVAIATIMACISLYLMYAILFRLQIAKEYIGWTMAGVFFGTGYWFAVITSHHVYAFAQITAFLFALLVLNELLGRKRWWLVGMYIGYAFLSRQLTIFYILFALGFMYYDYNRDKQSVTFRNFLALCSATGIFVLIYMVYNFVRFGNPLDTGYDHIVYIGILKDRVEQYGVFSWRYVLFNLYSVLIKGFNIEFDGNTYLNIRDMDLWGTSLLSASPFLIASVKASWPKILKIFAWLTIVAILIGQLFYHNNGYHQINAMRFALDFLPIIVVLMALGSKFVPGWLFKSLVAYSIVLNLVSFIIHFLYQN